MALVLFVLTFIADGRLQDHLDKCLVKLASETMLRERNCFERQLLSKKK